MLISRPIGRMASGRRIKRRLLREAVDDNVLLMRGERARHRRRSGGVYVVVRRLVLLALPIALLTASYVATRVAAEWRESPAEASIAAGRPIFLEPVRRPESRIATIDNGAPRSIPTAIDRSVLPLRVRRVVLDPGHGGEHRGTASVDGEMVEKDLTLDIAQRLRELLQSAAYEVSLTREEDATVSLNERGRLANERQADLFVSIHVNWLGQSANRGVETFYLGPTDDPLVERMAALENADGGVRLADFRSALERVYGDVRRGESRALAEAVQRSLLVSLRTLDPEVRNRGVKSAPFAVLLRTEMPAILAEVSSLSNEEEARQLRDPFYRQYLAEALFEGIRSYTEALHTSAVGG